MTQPVPHQAIYRRWRAQTFAEIVGQAAVVQTLRNAVRTNRVSHAILFVGPRGTGKTSLARILAKAINCTNLQDGDPCDTCPSCSAIREGRAFDLVEIDAASNRGIDAIRELRERINYAPTDLRRKVYILDEAHQITKDAWNALLKSLEEPPDFVVFMFASTHPQDFPPAILSRLQRFDIRRLTTPEIEGKLQRILEADVREVDPPALHLIARLAAGGMRDAESMLDQLLASAGDRLDEQTVRDLLGLATSEAVDGFLSALIAGDSAAGVRILDDLEDRGRDLRAFLEQVVEAVRGGLVPHTDTSASGTPVAASAPISAAQLVPVARRLAAIDPNRAGIGGLRLQLELALFPVEPGPAPAAVVAANPVSISPEGRGRVADLPPADETVERARPAAPAPARPARTPPAQPTAKAATSATPALPTPAVGTELALLRDRWPEVVARISAHPPTKPLIAVCRPISVDDGIVTLGFPEGQAFLRDVAERRRPVLEDGIGAILGHPVAVRCVATNLDLVPDPAAEADAAFLIAEAQRIFAPDGSDPVEVE